MVDCSEVCVFTAMKSLTSPSVCPIKPFFANDPQNYGAKLEYDVYQQIIDMGVFDTVLHERDLVAMYGWECSSIDNLIVIGNFIIPIQLKWRKTRRRETHGVENFIKSIHYIKKITKKEVLFGLWSSRIMPFEDNNMLLQKEKVVCVSFFEHIDGLVAKTINTIEKVLVLNKSICA